MISISELSKIKEFIIKNKKIIKANGLFDSEMELLLSKEATDFDENYFSNTLNSLIKIFIEYNFVLEKETPNFIKKDKNCIISSIKIDINSIIHVKSLDYFYFDTLEEKDELYQVIIREALRQQYELSNISPQFLRDNKEVVLSSIKKNISTFKYSYISPGESKEILKYLLLKNDKYEYIKRKTLSSIPISFLLDDEILDLYMEEYELKLKNKIKYNNRLKEILKFTLNQKPLIKDYKNLFRLMAEKDWEEHKVENRNYFLNVFSKICGQFESECSYAYCMSEMPIIYEIKRVLGKEFEIFERALSEYYNIYHNPNIEDKVNAIKKSRDIISKYSALYVAKSKELYIKSKIEELLSEVKPYYKLKMSSPEVNRNIINQKRMGILEDLYFEDNETLLKLIEKIKLKYKNEFDNNEELLSRIIEYFILSKGDEISELLELPPRCEEYIQYLKTLKLINRLNKRYIFIDGIECKNYKDLIGYDEVRKIYYYTGNTFTQEEITKNNEFQNLIYLYRKIRKDIVEYMKTIKIEELSLNEVKENKDKIEFNDDNFEFDIRILDQIKFSSFYSGCTKVNFDEDSKSLYENIDLENDTVFKYIFDYLFSNNLFWTRIILREKFLDTWANSSYIDKLFQLENIIKVILNMDKVISYMKAKNNGVVDISNIKELVDLSFVINDSPKEAIAVLGYEIIEQICTHLEFTCENKEKIIKEVVDLFCKMAMKYKSTVPYISGENSLYKYSLYDSLDPNMFLCGIYTDSCFKVKGLDNNFLCYCALNKNGFVIEIKDQLNNFVGKASGFRNGNCLFINQLRTIFDVSGNSYDGENLYERAAIISTITEACRNFVEVSQSNPNEEVKIDFVFVTKSYAFQNHICNVPEEVKKYIGKYPMETRSEDWEEFLKNDFLEECESIGFDNDYGYYDLICLASSKELRIENIIEGNVPALYERKRSPIIETTGLNKEIFIKINRIKAVYCHINKLVYEEVKISQNSIIYSGDNWFIIVNNGEIIEKYVIESDIKAKAEYNVILDMIKSSEKSPKLTLSI